MRIHVLRCLKQQIKLRKKTPAGVLLLLLERTARASEIPHILNKINVRESFLILQKGTSYNSFSFG